MSESDEHSVVVCEDNRYEVVVGDFTGLTTGGLKPVQCVSVHPSYHEAHAAAEKYRNLDRAEGD